MALLEARNLRKTYRLGKDRGRRRPCAASTSRSRPARWSRSWARRGPARAPSCTSSACSTSPTSTAPPAPSLVIGGRDMTKLSDGARTRTRARTARVRLPVLQPRPTLSAAENVALAAEYAGHGGSKGRTEALAALDLVGLADRARHRPPSSPAASSSASRSRGRSSIGPRWC